MVLKVFAGEDKDWLDIEGVAARQADRIDVTLVFRELEPLLELKGAAEAAARLRAILE